MDQAVRLQLASYFGDRGQCNRMVGGNQAHGRNQQAGSIGRRASGVLREPAISGDFVDQIIMNFVAVVFPVIQRPL